MAAQQHQETRRKSGISSSMTFLAKAISRTFKAINSLPLRQQSETLRVSSGDEAPTVCLKHAFTCQI
ncbi:hypothetical protein [Pseudomonas siliginis]|uniref:hypothetical protein n=1 Tax=Pseudomonas siliginis TaxID=2842346 RepID=UPI0021192AF0|nr:hypothetical protein [Pseudomonas siliginis]